MLYYVYLAGWLGMMQWAANTDCWATSLRYISDRGGRGGKAGAGVGVESWHYWEVWKCQAVQFF